MTETAIDPRITKKRVTMQTASIVPGAVDPDTGGPVTVVWTAVDYVREDFLDAYLADARTRWQAVEVSEEYDAGPGGYDGQTYVPDGLDTPLAGQTFPATEEG